jgi:hypothetical protein
LKKSPTGIREEQTMANTMQNDGQRSNPLRVLVWGAAGFLMLLPLIAMQFTSEVDWDVGDFVIFGVMLLVVCGLYEFATRLNANRAYRLAVGIALLASFLLVWMIGAVGILGVDGDTADLMYVGVFAVGIIGAIIARLQPRGMARTLLAMALTQMLVAVIALLAGMHNEPYGSVGVILGLNGFYAALFLGSAWLFRQAERAQINAGAERVA